MDWFEGLEQKRSFTLFCIILLMVATIAVTSLQDQRDPDVFWHLKMGQDWIEQGLSPWQDNYSFTFQGSDVDSPPVGFQVLLYGLVELLGVDGGTKVFKLISMLLVVALMLWWLKRIKAPVLVYGLVLPLLVTVLQLRATARPELISFSFAVLAIILYDRARSGIGVKQMFPIVLFMLVWNNYHSSIFGYVIFFGLFIDLAVNQLKQQSTLIVWLQWLAWGLILVAVGFANPSLSHPVFAALAFPEEWKNLIQEYHSPLMYKNVPALYLLILIAFVTLVLCWKQRLFGYLFVCLFFLSYAVTMARLVAPAGLVFLCVFAYVFGRLDYSTLINIENRIAKVAIPFAAVLVFIIPLLNNVFTARAFVFQNVTTRGWYPFSMVEYMKDSGRVGRILNEYDIGGFLIYQLAPDSQVYIDGRTNILYPLEHYLRLQDALVTSDVLKEEIEKYDIQYVITRSTSDKALLMEQTGLMNLDYADVRYFLYSRVDANVPTAGTLWARPYCWEKDDTKLLIEEGTTAGLFFTPDTQMHQFISLLTDYGNGDDRMGFLENQRETIYWPDASKRFVGYQALQLGNYQLAQQHFQRVRIKDPKDYLAISLAELRMARFDDAEATLAKGLSISWKNLELRDVEIMHALLTEIKKQQGWKILNDSYLNQFSEQITEGPVAGSGKKVGAETFCAEFD